MRLENIKFKNGNLSGITLHMDVNYSKMVFPNGNTDPEMISDIQNTNPEGKTILDVGAFIGSSSLLFSKLTKEHGKVIAFEPNLYNIKRIKKNFSLNKTLAKNIKLFELALLNIDGNIQMILNKQIDNGYSSTSRIVTSHPTLHNKDLPEGFEKRDVKVMKLDTFLEKNKFVPDIIKVDIEGSEYNFLNGAKETIKTHKPVLYIEIHSKYCAVKCYEILNSLGYHITILKEEDDNRIMVKAEHFKNRQPLSLDQKERILDSKIDQEQHIWQLLKEQIESEKSEFDKYKFKLNEALSTRIKDLEEFNTFLDNNLKIAKRENSNLKKEMKTIKDLLKKKEKKILKYQDSFSWKVTKPLRFVSRIYKKFKKRFLK